MRSRPRLVLPRSWVKSKLGPQPIWHVDASNAPPRLGEASALAAGASKHKMWARMGAGWAPAAGLQLEPGFGPPLGISVCRLLHLRESF